MKKTVLYDDGNIQWVVFGRDSSKPDSIIDTNEYLVQCQDETILIDPGGVEIFPNVLTAVSEHVELNTIKAFLCSHQDPDIMSSLPLWMALTPDAKIYLSWLWEGFVSHFGNEFSSNFVQIPDEGLQLTLGQSSFQLVPAHHLHSAGNFHLFDPCSGILFTGDVGAALLPVDHGMFVEDFEAHTQFMEKFHLRWMPSNSAKDIWLNRVRKLGVKMICPQHGAIFKGENVEKFFDWFDDLELGKLKRAS